MHDDELIDRAVHAMTRGEPSDQLRAAIRARIEKRPPVLSTPGLATYPPEPWQRRKLPRRLWIGAVASAAALVVLATMVGTPQAVRPATSPPLTVVARPPAVVTRIEPPAVDSPVVAPLTWAPPVRRARLTSAAPRIAVIDPLLIEPISVPLMAVDTNSGAMPMEIQPLQIEPLQPQ